MKTCAEDVSNKNGRWVEHFLLGLRVQCQLFSQMLILRGVLGTRGLAKFFICRADRLVFLKHFGELRP